MKKYVEHFLLLVLILVLACIEKTASSSVSVAPLPACDFRKFVHDRQGKLDGLVCSLYGFTHSSRSKPVRDIIIEKVQSIQNENGRIVYLVDSHAGDNCVTSNLFVAYLDRKEGSAALEHLLVKMQSIIDMSRRNHIAPQFILIYRDENFYEEEVNSLLNGNADTDVKVSFNILISSAKICNVLYYT